jgi:hypothetical protein
MERSLGIIREFKTRNFRVVVDAIEAHDVDLSFDDTGEVREHLQSGEYVAFAVRARCYLNGRKLADDYLDGCIYRSISEFQDHRECGAETRKLRAAGSDAICGSYFAEMVREVCNGARVALAEMQRVAVRK